ncbi:MULTISPECIES: hypothetical protein [unclassified Acinetobacter]|uniref:hypothetical protein n=1 Tax=unclassified Acinetobacter TaxID=196816 RepID=UPI0015D3AC7C|nr:MULTISPECIES: hypothetical protein [unclassified Acinetobacter]
MGGSSSQVVGYRYYAKFAAFIGNRIEKLIAVNFDNRKWVVHDPLKHPPNLLPVLEGNLFGENEGGVSGNIDIHFGTPDQEPNEVYQQYLPLVSGYPYQSYLLFRGYSFQDPFLGRTFTTPGFYLGNSGYMKEMLLWVKRIHVKNNGDVQWYDEKAEIPTYKVDETLGLSTGKIEANANTYTFPSVDNTSTAILAPNFPFFGGMSWGGVGVAPGQYKAKVALPGMVRYLIKISADNECYFSFEAENTIIHSINKYGAGSKEHIDLDVSVFGGGDILTIIAENTYWNANPGGYSPCSISFQADVIATYSGIPGDGGDINPIHKIREILTDDTAMGKPESDINDANFIEAANRIYDECLGISWAIDEKSCIDAIEELCYHIEAGIRVNRQTGLYEMVLFRDDWFAEDEIHTIAENKIKDLSLEVMNSDDIVNQLNVTYYDRKRIKNSTFSVYENGSILTMGKANAESIDFPYFMNMRNAEIVANWKLKQFSTPAWSGSLTTGWKEARKWNRYDLIRLPWSKKWNGSILVRIMKINLGNGTDNTVTIDFEEVIPYSGEMNTSIVVDAPINAAPQPPQPSMNAVFEAPYYLTVLRAGQTNADLELSNNPNIGYVAAIAAKPQNNSLNALLSTDGGMGEFEQVSRLDYCDILQLDQSINETASAFVVTGSLTQTANSNNFILLNDELMGFVSFNSETKVLTVKRGVLDTIPKKHNSGNLFVFDLPDVAFDSTQYTQSEIVEAQVLTTTPSGIQELSTTGTAVEIQARAIRPYPPANVKINGEYWPSFIDDHLALTWAHRNRLQQTGGEVLSWFNEDVTSETGVTYKVKIFDDETDLTIHEVSEITANNMVIDAQFLAPRTRIELFSVRDGYESLQKFEHIFSTAALEAPYNLKLKYTPDVTAPYDLKLEYL